MPSVARFRTWFIRVTAPWEYIKSKVDGLKSMIDYKGSVVGYHIGKSSKAPHAHICLTMNSELQTQSIRIRIKELFDLAKSQYSVVPWDANPQCIRYLYHDEEGEVIYDKIYTDDEKLKFQQESKIITEIVNHAKEKSSTKITAKILNYVKEVGTTLSQRQILMRILEGVRNGSWYPPGFRMGNIIEEIYLRQDEKDDEALKNYAQKHYAKYYFN